MEIMHRLSTRLTPRIEHCLGLAGVEPNREGILFGFDISDADPRWPHVKMIADEFGFGDIPSMKYTADEFASADWLEIRTSWVCGYPQPEANFGYRKFTYDLNNHCEECGAGKIQKAPFKMRREPGWRKRNITMLYWVEDEIFVKPDLWEEAFKPFGIDFWPVVKGRNCEQTLTSVVQIKVDTVADTPIIAGDYPTVTCEVCGRAKYTGFVPGFSPRPEVFPCEPIFRLKDYLGWGAMAARPVYICAELYRTLLDCGLRGAILDPVAK